MVRYERAGAQDEEAIRLLLEDCGLHHEDLAGRDLADFTVAKKEARAVGVVGLELLGEQALLRSLAVREAYRGQGIGSVLVRMAEDYARAFGADRLYLLTNTAELFFSARGYHRIDRASAPDPLQGTTEFQSLCPASAACMTKRLQGRDSPDPTRCEKPE